MVEQTYLDKVKKIIAEHPFVMLSKSWCPDCHYTYGIWERYGVMSKIHIIELDKFEDQENAMHLERAFTEFAGRKWVPSLFFNGEFIGTEKDLKDWDEQGRLDEVFKKSGLIQ